MQSYQSLIAEHEALDTLAQRLIALAGTPDDIAALLAVRAQLSGELEAHLSKEDSFLYERAISLQGGDFANNVARFNTSFADLTADWADYLTAWDTDSVAADWTSFANETITLMGRLRERIFAENTLIYPLALHQGRIRLRAA